MIRGCSVSAVGWWGSKRGASTSPPPHTTNNIRPPIADKLMDLTLLETTECTTTHHPPSTTTPPTLSTLAYAHKNAQLAVCTQDGVIINGQNININAQACAFDQCENLWTCTLEKTVECRKREQWRSAKRTTKVPPLVSQR